MIRASRVTVILRTLEKIILCISRNENAPRRGNSGVESAARDDNSPAFSSELSIDAVRADCQ
jgi:hypothetical protein